MKFNLKNGYDFILLVYPETELTSVNQGLSNRVLQLDSLFSKAGLLK